MRIPGVPTACVLAAALFPAAPAPAAPDATPAATAAAAAPAGPAVRARLRLFLDCADGDCDLDFLRRELGWVDWVRDRHDADVHVLVTGRFTGDGGTEARLCFLRRPGHGPPADTLGFHLPRDSTPDAVRRALARALAAGLARDLVGTPAGERLEVRVPAPPGGPAPPPPDAWRGWVLSAALNGSFNGEQTYRTSWLNSSLSARRVTEERKLGLGLSQNYSDSRYTFADSSRYTSISRGAGLTGRAVWSVAPRWSVGGRAWLSNSSYANQDLSLGAGPVLEYDVFPYAESDRRSLTLAWGLTASRIRYLEETIYGRTRETLVSHRLVAALRFRQPWGSTGVSVEGSEYLRDGSRYHLALEADADLRLCRGLSCRLSGSWQRVRDQLSLPRAGASDEDVIARQRQLATSYYYWVSVGLSYTFGSPVNNVVNPRLDEVLGGF